jgi:uncharacterized damage-inducible protein DinB
MNDTRQYLATITRFMAQAVARTAPFTPSDKRNWSPMGAARTTIDVLQECAEALEMGSRWMKSSQIAGPDPQARAARAEALKKNPPKLEDVLARLQKASEQYAQDLEKFPAERMTQMVTSPFSGQPMPMAALLGLPVFNMIYHWGQINYVQTMLGDTEMH